MFSVYFMEMIKVTKKKTKVSRKTNMTITIDTKYYNFLKRVGYQLSVDENKKIGLSEVVRRALESKFPVPPDQMEMDFGGS
jgi:hypothetical protein